MLYRIHINECNIGHKSKFVHLFEQRSTPDCRTNIEHFETRFCNCHRFKTLYTDTFHYHPTWIRSDKIPPFPSPFSQSRATWARRRIKLQSPISKGYKFHVLHSKSYTLTGLSCTTSGFFVTASYHKSHRVLLAANEPNRFMWRVMRAHLSDLKFATRFGCMLWKFLECMSSVLEMNFFRGYGVYEFNGFRLG